MNLLFVCTGNICRSPMAEALSVAIGTEHGLDVNARSAGTLDLDGRGADPKAIKVCQQRGVSLHGHRSQPVDASLLAWADYVLGMQIKHTSHVRDLLDTHRRDHPDSTPLLADERLLLLGPFGGHHEIADPYRGWIWTFRRSRREIEACLHGFFERVR